MTAEHTRTSTDLGPDFCTECAAAAQEWVAWPCLSEEVVAALDAIDCAEDPEAAHGKADDLLVAYVPPEVGAAYLRVMSRCAWWGTA